MKDEGGKDVPSAVQSIESIKSGQFSEVHSFSPFLNDIRFLNSPAKDGILQINLPETTVTIAEKVIRELRIKTPPTIIRSIPSLEEMKYIIPTLGIGGRAISSSEIRLYIDPSHPKIVESLTTWCERQIAHELNHTARIQVGKRGSTLLDAFVSEGLATNYEENWGGIKETPWGHALTKEQVTSEWQKAQNGLGSTNYDHSSWFYYSRDEEHPMWTGYSLGTAIVKSYRELHPNETMLEIINKTSDEILEGSSFKLVKSSN